jgi:hypothetical protein
MSAEVELLDDLQVPLPVAGRRNPFFLSIGFDSGMSHGVVAHIFFQMIGHEIVWEKLRFPWFRTCDGDIRAA